jgi:Zn-dependent peptidase ImmA (M78 family)
LNSVDISQERVINYDLGEDGFETPEEVACAVREYWGLPSGKIENMVKTLEDAGIIVIPYTFPTRKFSGVSLLTHHGNWVILVNQELPADRIRFTLAHELGHIIMHRFPTATMEQEADSFASEFLLPSRDIENQLKRISLEKLAYLKLEWKVSMAAILRKAHSLGKLTDNQYRYWNMQMSAAGFRTSEPIQYNVPYEKPSLLEEIIKVHTIDLNYSMPALNKVVNLYHRDFKAIHQIEYFEEQKIPITNSSSENSSGLTLVAE